MRKFGLSPEKTMTLLEEQNYLCKLCGGEFDLEGKRPFCVDHDHNCCPGEYTCGKCIRGLLCDSCNKGLGNFKDSPELLSRAVAYLVGSVQQSKDELGATLLLFAVVQFFPNNIPSEPKILSVLKDDTDAYAYAATVYGDGSSFNGWLAVMPLDYVVPSASGYPVVGSGAPASPAAPDVTFNSSNATYDISWEAPSDDGAPITGYIINGSSSIPSTNVQYSVDGGTTSVTSAALSMPSGTSPAPFYGVPYTWTVTAVNEMGSSVSEGTTPDVEYNGLPALPENIQMSFSNGRYYITWDQPTSPNAGTATQWNILAGSISYTATSSPFSVPGPPEPSPTVITAQNSAGTTVPVPL